MKNTILLLLLVLTLPISAQNENSALFRELTDAMCLNQRERLWMIDYMTHWSNSTLTIDGVEYLTSYNPLALVSDSLEHLRLYDGILGEDVEEYVTIRDSWGDRPNTNDSYCCTWALDNKHLILTGIYRQGWKEVDDAERVHINKRMEDFTGCKFVGNRMFLNALSGTLYVKAANTESKPCDIGTNKREMDCPEYVRWVFEPVYRLTFKNGTLVSREELICCDGVDFEQDDLSVEDVVIYQKVDAPPVFLNEMKAIENKEIKDLLDAEALRIVNAMPRWEPARDNKGKKFDSGAELIIDFRLQKNKVPVAVVDESDFGCKYHVTIWQEPRKMKNHGDDILKP